MSGYNDDRNSAWFKAKGPAMPRVIQSLRDLPIPLLRKLEDIRISSELKQNFAPGYVLRLGGMIEHLFGVSQVMTMWKKNADESYSPFSPQLVTSIPPAQAIFSVVDIETDPKIIFLKKARDLCLQEEYAMVFWNEGLTPEPMAVKDYMGSVHPEFPRGALADGVGFKTTPEAEQELGLKTKYFIRIPGANPDPGQMMSPIPYRIAFMSAEKEALDVDGEADMIKGLLVVKPEALFKQLDTYDGITQSQVFASIRYIVYEFNKDTEVLDGQGNKIELSDEEIMKIRMVFIRILQGPLDDLKADC